MSSKNRKTMIIKEIEEGPSDLKKFVDKQLEENDGAIVHPLILPAEEIKDMPSVTLKKVQADPWLNIRNKPSMSDSDVIGKLFTDDVVEIFATKDGFAKISDTENKWVSMDFLVPVYSKEQLEN